MLEDSNMVPGDETTEEREGGKKAKPGAQQLGPKAEFLPLHLSSPLSPQAAISL